MNGKRTKEAHPGSRSLILEIMHQRDSVLRKEGMVVHEEKSEVQEYLTYIGA